MGEDRDSEVGAGVRLRVLTFAAEWTVRPLNGDRTLEDHRKGKEKQWGGGLNHHPGFRQEFEMLS